MEINQKIDKTVDWLREKVKEAGCKGLVVGVSGGKFIMSLKKHRKC